MSDISLVVDKEKSVYAFTPLNEASKAFLESSEIFTKYENTYISNADNVIKALDLAEENELVIDLWKKTVVSGKNITIEDL